MPEFHIIIARQIFFPNFRGTTLSPVSYAYKQHDCKQMTSSRNNTSCGWMSQLVSILHRRRSSVNIIGKTLMPENICIKFVKNVRILHDNCPKNICPYFFFGGGGGRDARAPRLLCLWCFVDIAVWQRSRRIYSQ